jgi:hypothetical protein
MPKPIVGVDFNAPQSKYFQLEYVSEIYAMQYEAIYLYIDVNHVDYKKTHFLLMPSQIQ